MRLQEIMGNFDFDSVRVSFRTLRVWLAFPAFAMMLSGCSGHLMPAVRADEFRNIAPISKSLLLLIPQEFAGHLYTGGTDKRTATFKFGESTTKLLPVLMDRIFTTVDVREVTGDATSALASNVGAGGRDYVAVPRFVTTNSTVTGGGVNIETGLALEFVASDGSRKVEALGSGKGFTHIWAQAALQTTAGIALRNALTSLIQDINKKRDSF